MWYMNKQFMWFGSLKESFKKDSRCIGLNQSHERSEHLLNQHLTHLIVYSFSHDFHWCPSWIQVFCAVVCFETILFDCDLFEKEALVVYLSQENDRSISIKPNIPWSGKFQDLGEGCFTGYLIYLQCFYFQLMYNWNKLGILYTDI